MPGRKLERPEALAARPRRPVEQGTLFGESQTTGTEPCDACGIGRIVISRTPNPFEDHWRCGECGIWGTISHSRTFGPRFEETVQQTAPRGAGDT